MTEDEEIALLAMLLRRPRSKLKTFARMRKRDRLFALWAQSDNHLAAMTNAVRFHLEEPLLEATREERADLEPWLIPLSARVARELVGEISDIPTSAPLAREDALIKLATRAAVEVFAGLGLIVLWQWVTQRDARVCSRCGPMDGRILPSEMMAPLPMHQRCRCGLRPVVK